MRGVSPAMIALSVWLVSTTASVVVSAATVTATDCSQPAVKAAIAAARVGDSVEIPAGSCDWSTGISLGSKGLHVRGVAPGAVSLIHNAGSASLLSLSENADRSVEISGLRFVEGSGGANAWQGMFIEVNGAGRPVLIHDNYFETRNGGRRAIRVNTNRGVIWGNEFFASRQDGQAIHFTGPSTSWITADTMGVRDTTGEANVYVEDNLFRLYPAQVMDPDSNSRVVIRHNTFEQAGMASHGADTSEEGTRHWEVYDNTFSFLDRGDCDGSKTFGLVWYFYIRGGTGIIADNVMADIKSCAWGDKPEVYITVQNIARNAGPYPCWTSYPVPRQVGQGHDGTGYVTDPVYIWGNDGNPRVSVGTYRPDECGNGQKIEDYLREGRDYIFGSRPGYAKFAYPHPLRRGSRPPESAAIPRAPTNLHVQ